MATCKKCDKAILDEARICSHCGQQEPVDGTDKKIVDVLNDARTRDCKHCKGTGECGKEDIVIGGKTHEYSCSYCFKKAGVNDRFSKAPCGHCEGKGFYPVESGRKDEQQTKDKKKI